MTTAKAFINRIIVAKHGIHDIISELVYKFNFHKILPNDNNVLAFIAMCVGLILFNNPAATFIAQKLAWVSHDALTRLLPLVSINSTNIMILFIKAIQSQTADLGHLIIDDVIVREPFGKSIAPALYVYDHTNNNYVWRIHIAVLLWSNGWIKVPVAFRIWIPKEKCERYHTKVELAENMISFAYKQGLAAEYVTFDTWYSSKELLTKLSECAYPFVCMIKSNRKVLYNNSLMNVKTLSLYFNKKQYRYYSDTGFYIKAVSVILPGVGSVKMSIVKNGYNASLKETRFIITNLPNVPAQGILKKYLWRWEIEVFFRDIKQFLNFEKAQVRSLKKLDGHFSMVFIISIFLLLLVFFSLTGIGNAYIVDRKWYNTTIVPFYANDDIAYDCIYAFGNAAYTWSMTPPYAIALSYQGIISVPSAFTRDSYNTIIGYSMPGSSTIMLTYSWRDDSYSPPKMLEFDIAINTDKPFSTTGDPGCFDVQNIATHEFGHSLFSGDVYTSYDVQPQYANEFTEVTMYYASSTEPTEGMKKRTLHQDDIDGFDYAY